MAKVQASGDSAGDSLEEVEKLLDAWPVAVCGPGSSDSDLLLKIKDSWATWQDDLHTLGLDRLEVMLQFQKHRARLEQLEETRRSTAKVKLLKIYDQASEKSSGLIRLLHESEKCFMHRMAKNATALANLQGQLVSHRTSFSVSDQGSGASESDISAKAVEIQYLVSVYTAITFYRLPATWKPNCKQAQKNQESLRLALQSMTGNEDIARFELDCGHQLVAQIRKDLKLEGPKRKQDHSNLTVSDLQGATASSQVPAIAASAISASGQGGGDTVEQQVVHSPEGAVNAGGNSVVDSQNAKEENVVTIDCPAAPPDENAKGKGKGKGGRGAGCKGKGKGAAKKKSPIIASLLGAHEPVEGEDVEQPGKSEQESQREEPSAANVEEIGNSGNSNGLGSALVVKSEHESGLCPGGDLAA